MGFTSFLRRTAGFVFSLLCLAQMFSLYTAAETAPFDLIGPKVEVRVKRSGVTLPISEVPNLQVADRLWIHADLPESQSVHYLMVVVFLRGATNPPPDSWFTRVETWIRPIHDEGIYITVPEEAEEALIMLAPDTGGAFSTLRTAVRGKPGAFVRAAQDLEQAGLDRARLEKYLDAVREISASDPEQLKSRTPLLARSLNIRLDRQCFDKPSDQQAPCLTQNTDQLVLDDAHSQTMVATLTSGASSDLLSQISSTPTAHGGYYSPYVGAVVDVARILGTAHTAQYQYIPALSVPKKDDLNLRLNNPPSFRNPKSVLVIGLPGIRPSPVPPLRAVDPSRIFCSGKASLLLPADGAPLAFATELAHNFVLSVTPKSGPEVELPAEPDPAAGGFVVATHALAGADLAGEVTGVLRGSWGFQAFDGPHYRLRTASPGQWIVASKDASALIVGRQDVLHLQSPDACCVNGITLRDEAGKPVATEWKGSKGDELEVKVSLQNAAVGPLTMMITKFGAREPDEIPLHTYAEAARLDGFTIHVGDSDGILKGTRLDQVKSLELKNLHFAPRSLTRANQQDELSMTTADVAAQTLRPNEMIVAHVTLKDGRVLDIESEIKAPRPKVTILTKSVQFDGNSVPPMVHLGSTDELPQEGRLNFFLRAEVPESFSPAEKIEVATADESFHAFLSLKEGNLTMQDTKTVFAVLDPMKLLGPSAFGPLKFRPVTEDGIDGDWQPLVNLVRIPTLRGFNCVPAGETQCILAGDKLFLLDSVSIDPDFANPVTVPEGFVQDTLPIPAPKAKTLYIKLRDDPAIVDIAVVPTLPNQQ
jgi:hypothetical protein